VKVAILSVSVSQSVSDEKSGESLLEPGAESDTVKGTGREMVVESSRLDFESIEGVVILYAELSDLESVGFMIETVSDSDIAVKKSEAVSVDANV
jgi:hypothetical protein